MQDQTIEAAVGKEGMIGVPLLLELLKFRFRLLCRFPVMVCE